MTLPKTSAETIEDRRNEIVSTKNDDFLKVKSYRSYDSFPETKPYNEKPENIRFYKGGVEALVKVTTSGRAIGNGTTLEHSPMDTTFIFQLIDENNKRILEYSIDATSDEF